jgi:hypothetical protein
VPPAWRPVAEVPPEIEEVLGVWHWGCTPHVFSAENSRDGVQLVVRKDGVLLYRFAPQGGRLVGVAGHHHGETLRVVRHPDGSVSHLDLRTFLFTRTPYDPDVPVPGGPPGR